jgi:hypothetical protein
VTAPKTPEVDLQEFLDAIADEEELARLEGLTEAQLDEELRSKGVDPGRAVEIARRVVEEAGGGTAGGTGEGGAAATVAEKAQTALAAPKGKVLSLAPKQRKGPTGTVMVALALAAGVAATLGYARREEITAWFAPGPAPTGTTTTPAPPEVPPTHEETPLEKARRLREEAYVDVAKGYYGEAWDRLEEAKGIDPKGDAAEKVQAAWKEVQDHKPQPRGFVKPGVGPGEVPLKRSPVPPKQP